MSSHPHQVNLIRKKFSAEAIFPAVKEASDKGWQIGNPCNYNLKLSKLR